MSVSRNQQTTREQIALGGDRDDALRIASEVEQLARTYWGCLAIGEPVLFDKGKKDEVLASIASYGQQNEGK